MLPANIRHYALYGGEKVIFERDEVVKMRRLDVPGLHLIGFLPLQSLKQTYNIKNANFLQPDEIAFTGSTPVFIALLQTLIDEQKLALCRLIMRAGGDTRLVYLVAQEAKCESQPGAGDAISAGFHIFHLPFADDMRKVFFFYSLFFF